MKGLEISIFIYFTSNPLETKGRTSLKDQWFFLIGKGEKFINKDDGFEKVCVKLQTPY